ncbi:reverse transcriptase domain-containing protein [Tanacetum coccineum]
MKKQMAELPTLIAPIEGESLIMYLSTAGEAVSTVLLAERGNREMPIYFVGRALQSPKVNYTPMEKLILALVNAARRLRRHFQAHPVAVITDQPIRQILSRIENSKRLAKRAIELEVPTREINQVEEAEASEEVAEFKASKNEAEYEALLAGLRIADSMGVKHIETFVDSKLVANQINNLYQAKEEAMQLYMSKAKDLAARFRSFSITQVPRSQNKQADALSKMAFVSFAHLTKEVLVEILPCKSIKGTEVMEIVEEEGDTWMTPIKEYLEKGTLPEERGKARWLRTRARQYVMLEGTLYRNMHSGPRSIVTKAMQMGDYWSMIHMDARMADQTMIKSSNENTPFSLTYDTNAIIPVKIGMQSLRCSRIDKNKNDEGLLLNLDLLEEKRELADIAEEKYKRKMEGYYNSKVQRTILRPGLSRFIR